MQISIITINFNDYDGLKKTMNSVFEQTHDNIEYIVIDGGSNDKSVSFIEEHKNKLSYWSSEKDGGVYDALNKGIDHAHGEYILFLNSGDYLVDTLVVQNFVSCKPVEDLVYGNTLIDDGENQELLIMPNSMDVFTALTHTINHQSIFFKKRLFDDGSRYDLKYSIVADWVFVNNAIIKKHCTWKHIDLVIPVYDTNGISSDANLRGKERRKYLEENFDEAFLRKLDAHNLKNNKIQGKKRIKNIVMRVLRKMKKILK